MQKPPLVISFFTPDWVYPQHGKRLRDECVALDLDSYIVERASAGGYLENTRQKPVFILETLRAMQRPVLWIDVDASIYQPPVFFSELAADISLRPKDRTKYKRQWHVGTMWFNYTPAAISFLEAWCATLKDVSDESALEDLHRAGHPGVIEPMPKTYHEIGLPPFKVQPDTVIMHRISTGQSKHDQSHRFTAHS